MKRKILLSISLSLIFLISIISSSEGMVQFKDNDGKKVSIVDSNDKIKIHTPIFEEPNSSKDRYMVTFILRNVDRDMTIENSEGNLSSIGLIHQVNLEIYFQESVSGNYIVKIDLDNPLTSNNKRIHPGRYELSVSYYPLMTSVFGGEEEYGEVHKSDILEVTMVEYNDNENTTIILISISAVLLFSAVIIFAFHLNRKNKESDILVEEQQEPDQ